MKLMQREVWLWLIGCLLCEAFSAPTSWAIPAFARKYGVSCNVCHSPNVPRLSAYGHQFRKLGYRVPEEIGKQPEYKEIGQYISMRGRMRYDYENFKAGRKTNGFRWNDATLFYAGPVTPNLSSFFELEVNESNELEPLGQFSWLVGEADHFAQIRLGQFHTLSRVGWAGFDRPSGINTTQILSSTLTSSAVPFTFSKDERGIELSLGLNRDIRLIGQLLNGLDASGSGTTGTRDNDADKDVLLAYEQMIGERGSGITGVFYRGVWHQAAGTVVNGAALPDDDAFRKFTFYRYGLTGSWLFGTPMFPKLESELQGGAIFAEDVGPKSYPAAKGNASGQAYYFGLEEHFKEGSVFSRFDFRNIKVAGPDNWRRRYTLGAAKQVNDYLRLAIEGFVNDPDAATHSIGTNAEAMFNF